MNAWDANASRRYQQIVSGVDLSYSHVLIPAILANLPQPSAETGDRLLDAGCGPGVLANRLHEMGWRVAAIDESPTMVQVATHHSTTPGPSFRVGGFLELPSIFPAQSFDAVVANMSITGILALEPALRAVREVLRPDGRLVVSDVHPFFWRYHKGHPDLSYWSVTAITEQLTIGLDPEPLPAATTVVYRPLEALTTALEHAGFFIRRMSEPRPPAEVERQRPEAWRLPRFLVIVAEVSSVLG